MAGDEQRAIELFAEVNAEQIVRLDVSGRNALHSSVDRWTCDRILEVAGDEAIRLC